MAILIHEICSQSYMSEATRSVLARHLHQRHPQIHIARARMSSIHIQIGQSGVSLKRMNKSCIVINYQYYKYYKFLTQDARHTTISRTHNFSVELKSAIAKLGMTEISAPAL